MAKQSPDKTAVDIPQELASGDAWASDKIAEFVDTVKNPNPPESIKPKMSASDLLSKLLEDNGLELYVSSVYDNIKTVSDGSIIFAKPVIKTKYKNG